MRIKLWILVAFLALAILPSLAFGQTDPPVPPVCCNQDPPPPPTGNSKTSGTTTSDLTLEITVSDSDLAASGLTRSQFIASLAVLLFPSAGNDVSVVVPVLIESGDPAVPDSVAYYEFEIDKVGDEILDAITWLYLTDGNTFVTVVFAPNLSPSAN